MSRRVTDSAPEAHEPGRIRNVVLVGHGGSGTTTLFEHLLASALGGHRPQATDPDDRERAATLTPASFETGRVLVNLLDAPGQPDFTGELRAGLCAADAALFVVSAAGGVDPATISLWQECQAVGMPRAIVVTKLDTGQADFDGTVATCQQVFGEGVLPTHLPLPGAAEAVVGNLDLITQQVHDYSGGTRQVRSAAPEHLALIEERRAALIEGLITESEDDALMDRYLAGDALAVETVLADLLTAVAHATFHPVIPVSVTSGAGTDEVLTLIETGFPSPVLHPLPRLFSPQGASLPEGACDPDGPLVAEVVATTSDPYAGRQSLVRVFAGTLRPDEVVHVSGHRAQFSDASRPDAAAHPDHDEDERVGPLSAPVGTQLCPKSRAIAGEVVVVSKLSHAETSDTLSSPRRPAVVEPWRLPDPLLPVAVHAMSRTDEDKLAVALQRLVVEDMTLRLERSTETDQLVLWTMGQAHVDLLLDRLSRRYGAAVESEPLRVALRETFVAPADAEGRHVKQSGGHGQYAVCRIEVEPLQRGGGFEFVDKVVGGAVPRQYVPSVEKGVRAQLAKGCLAGYPMVDVRVTLVGGKAHSVDSSDMAFQTAGALALRDAASAGTVTLLEPVDAVSVVVAEEHVGPVMSDLSVRRGRVVGTDSDADGHATIRAAVPRSELARYAIELPGVSHGTGSFTREPAGYEVLPPQLAGEHLPG